MDLATFSVSTAQAMLRKQPNEEVFGEGNTKNLYPAERGGESHNKHLQSFPERLGNFTFLVFQTQKNPGRVTNRQSYKEQNLKSFQCQFYTKKKIHKRGEGGMNLTKN